MQSYLLITVLPRKFNEMLEQTSAYTTAVRIRNHGDSRDIRFSVPWELYDSETQLL